MTPRTVCPSCGSGGLRIFHRAAAVPSNSCILLESRRAALAYPRGDITLGGCPECGFVTNTSFVPALTEYSGRYEETQGFSPTFRSFHRELAERLVERFDLRDRDILEIGCGKGEFLLLLCEGGRNRGVGFDPAYRPDRNAPLPGQDVRFVRDFYSERHSGVPADFVCCKMTLEHIPDTAAFLSMVRRTLGDRDATLFLMVPDATRILNECAFEDIYYEHCSYFGPASMARLLRECGFRPLEMGREYDGQYLVAIADTADPGSGDVLALEGEGAGATAAIQGFAERFSRKLSFWRDLLARGDGPTVLWGSGSKGVAFLTTLGLDENEIAGAVDINPHRQGTFMPGTGHRIFAPEDLAGLRPRRVIAMNPVYRDEIAGALADLGLSPQLLTAAEEGRAGA